MTPTGFLARGRSLWRPCHPGPISLLRIQSACGRRRPGSLQAAVGQVAACASIPALPPAVGRITSTSNAYVKHCVRLRTSAAYRREVGRVLLVGSVLLRELLDGQVDLNAHAVFVPTSGCPDIGEDLGPILEVSDSVLKKLSGVESVMGVGAIAEVDMPWRGSWQASAVPRRVLALEGVQDPGNVGTLLRTAVAFGWDSVFLLPGCCDPFNDKALRSGRGAAFQVPLVAGTWDELGAFAKDNQLRCLAAVARTQDNGNGGDSNCGAALNGWWGAKYKEGVCLVLGSEGQGLSAESRQYCEAVNIPIGDRMESLNVAVAGGILMFLLRLQ